MTTTALAISLLRPQEYCLTSITLAMCIAQSLIVKKKLELLELETMIYL